MSEEVNEQKEEIPLEDRVRGLEMSAQYLGAMIKQTADMTSFVALITDVLSEVLVKYTDVSEEEINESVESTFKAYREQAVAQQEAKRAEAQKEQVVKSAVEGLKV